MGYVKIYKPELKIKDYEIYKGVYCSICKKIGKNFGLIARLLLSYDFTFFAILRLAVEEKNVDFYESRCSFNPLAKCKRCDKNNEIIDYVSNCVVIVAYYKIIDNISDNRFLKKFPYWFILPYMKVLFLKAKKRIPEIEKIVSDTMKKQKEIEESKNNSIDLSAEPTALAMAKILSFGLDDGDIKRIVERIGYCLGKWVYIIDALDDFNKDKKNHNYNPFLSYGDFEKAKDFGEGLLELIISEIIDAYNLLENKRFDEIIKNILYYGMYNEMKVVLSEGGKVKNEKSI